MDFTKEVGEILKGFAGHRTGLLFSSGTDGPAARRTMSLIPSKLANYSSVALAIVFLKYVRAAARRTNVTKCLYVTKVLSPMGNSFGKNSMKIPASQK